MSLQSANTTKKRRKRRSATVYDAVAGRVGYEGFLSDPRPSKFRDTTSTSTTAVPPEEILFRRRRAPARHEEDDIYFRASRLKDNQPLPDSDLLKTIHAYSSDWYAAMTDDRGSVDFLSLDETALLALGILLEEAAREAVGGTRYLEQLETLVNTDTEASSG